MFARTILRSSAPAIGTAAIGSAVYASQRPDQSISSFTTSASQPTSTLTPLQTSNASKTFTSGFSFQTLKLRSSEEVNHNTKRLRFDLPDSNAVSGLEPVSALLTKASVNGAWLPTMRPYTPISDPDEPGHVDLLVKRYDTGKMSNHLHSLQPGQTLSFKTGPLSGYPYTANKHSHVALLAGGAGITPMYQLTHAILRNPDDRTKITLVFGVNTDEDLLFREEFTSLEKQYAGRFKCVYTVSHPTEDDEFPHGYITRQLLEKTIPGPKEEGVKVLFCGPPAMEKAVVGGEWFGGVGGILKELGYSKEQVVKL